MASIKDAIRLCKRIMLTNLLTNDYSIAVTPLLSGKHGIGKSQVAKQLQQHEKTLILCKICHLLINKEVFS